MNKRVNKGLEHGLSQQRAVCSCQMWDSCPVDSCSAFSCYM